MANGIFRDKNFWLRHAVTALFVGALLPVETSATVLTFDDVQTNPNAYINSGYGGLSWNNFYAMNPENFQSGVTGYSHGLVSGQNIAFNGSGEQAIITRGTAFNFDGVYLTGAWKNGLNIVVSGSFNGNMLYYQSVYVDSYQPTWFGFNFSGIDMLTFSSSGGTPVYCDCGNQFAMDNFTFNEPSAVPVPASAWLFGSGLLGLAGFANKRETA